MSRFSNAGVSVADKRLDLRSPILHSSKHLLIVLVVVKTKSKSDYSPILRSGVYLANQNGCAIAPMLVLLKNLTATKPFETSTYSWLQHDLEQGWTTDFDSNFDRAQACGLLYSCVIAVDHHQTAEFGSEGPGGKLAGR